MSLAAGSIAIIGFNADGNDNLAFVTFEPIRTGTEIYFWSDRADATIVWTAQSDLDAGTVVTLDDLNQDSRSSNHGTVSAVSGNFRLHTSNEEIVAYTGSADAPETYLTAFGSDGLNSSLFNASGLVAGLNAVDMDALDGDADLAVYSGFRVSTTGFDEFKGQVFDFSNWTAQDGGGNQYNDGIYPDLPFDASPFRVDPEANEVSFAAGSALVSGTEGDSGITTLTFTVERTGGTEGALTFSGAIITGGMVNGADFSAGEVPRFSGTIAAGQASGTFTVEISGDVDFEQNETFSLVIDTVANEVNAVFVALDGGASATGEIVNDDQAPVTIAFTGLSTEGADNLAFVALGDIATGTTIYFSEDQWTGEAFNGNQSFWSWTAADDIAAGTIVTMDGLAAGEIASSNLGAVAFGSESGRGLEARNEVIYAYLADAATPTAPEVFLTAITTVAGQQTETYFAGTGLVPGETVVTLPGDTDIAAYTGPRDGVADLDEFFGLLHDRDNWTTQTGDYPTSQDGLAPDIPFSREGFQTGTGAQKVSFGDLTVVAAEGDSGTTVITFTVTRTGGALGRLDFAGSVVPLDGIDAADFAGDFPTGFSGTIADGVASATVSLEIAGDIAFEADETIELRLDAVANQSAQAVIGEGAIAQAVIENDDVPQVVQFNSDSYTVAENDSGETVITFTVERSGGVAPTAGAVDFAGTIAFDGASEADFATAPGSVFSGTIAAGQTRAEISFVIADDAVIERDEHFVLTLDSVSNAESPITLGATAAATGTILDDEPVPVIAFTSFNTYGDNQGFTFVALNDIAAGTQIHFTDNSWSGSSFSSNEGFATWTAEEDVAAGTVIEMDYAGLLSYWEVVYAYIGEDQQTPSVFLAGFANFLFSYGGTLEGTGLVDGVNAIEFDDTIQNLAQGQYVGPRFGEVSLEDYRDLVNDENNWTGIQNNADGLQLHFQHDTTAFTDSPVVQLVGFGDDVMQTEGDSGETQFTFVVNRDGGDGALDFTGHIDIGGVLTEADFTADQSMTIAGSFADGETSATVTVSVAGDSLPEGDESFTLTLDTVTGATVPAYIDSGAATATGTILDDDPAPADILFTGFYASESESMAFVAMGDIAAGTTIHFSSIPWNGDTFTGSGAIWSWTAAEDIATGTVVTMDWLSDSTQATATHGSIVFDQGTRAYLDRYDVVYAYTGETATVPQAFITAFGTYDLPRYGSLEGTGLVYGDNAVLTETIASLAIYDGATSGYPDFDEYRTALTDGANWALQANTNIEGHDGVYPDLPYDTGPFTIDPTAQIVEFDADSLEIAVVEGDDGAAELTFTVIRRGGTDGALDFSGTVVRGGLDSYGEANHRSGTLIDSDFADGSTPLAFSGTIAEGETTGTVTIRIAGDDIHEADESFHLVLDSGENDAAPVAIGTETKAVGTILDDDDHQVDLAFLGYSGTGANHALSFVALTDIAVGTEIHFTNRYFLSQGFHDEDGTSTWTWTATDHVAAGEVVNLENMNGDAAISNHGEIAHIGTGGLGTAGGYHTSSETIYAYTGDIDAPTAFIAAATPHFTSFVSVPDPDLDDEAYFNVIVGTGLTSGVDAAQMRIGNNGAFVGPRGGWSSWEELKSHLVAGADGGDEWANEGDARADSNGIWPDLPFTELSFSIDPDAQIVGFADEPLQALPELNEGEVQTYSFTVERSNGTTGDVAFTGKVLVGSYADGDPVSAEDFGGVAPVFSGVIADGETSTTITIEVPGDLIYEVDKIFTVALTSISNTEAAAVAGTYITTAEILDYDNTQPDRVQSGEIFGKTFQLEGGTTFVIEEGGAIITGPINRSEEVLNWITDGDLTIENHGTLQGENILDEVSDGNFILNNHETGLIYGEFDPENDALKPGYDFIINNGGEIRSDGRVFDFGDMVDGGGFVTVNNFAGGLITADTANSDLIRMGARGVINNAGRIAMAAVADDDEAIDFQGNPGGVVNNLSGGWIEGAHHAVTGDEAVIVLNEAGATMIGRNGGAVNIDNDATEGARVYVTNYGTMEGRSAETRDSDGDAIDVDGLLTLENYGFVGGMGAEGYHDGEPNVSEGVAIGGGTINNHEGGDIYGYGRGIQVDNSSNANALGATDITNAGLIRGDGNGPEGVDEEDAALFDLRGNEAVNLVGTYADSFTNAATGEIRGGVAMGGGNDVVINDGVMHATGGAALDLGDGDDTLYLSAGSLIDGLALGGAGSDRVEITASDAADTITLALLDDAIAVTLNGTLMATLDAASFETIAIDAMGGNDRIQIGDGVGAYVGLEIDGGTGSDVTMGGEGDDEIMVGAGRNNVLSGGDGADVFRFGDTLSNGDRENHRITDFDTDVDMLDLNGAEISRYREMSNAVIIYAGEDNDAITLVGVTEFDRIDFFHFTDMPA